MRLAELLVAFSAVADLGMGLPVGEAARPAHVAVKLARGQGMTEPEVADVFAAALLQHIGCTAYSHEVSLLFADETAVKRTAMATDFTRPREIALGWIPNLVRRASPGQRLRTLRSAVLHSRRMTEGYQLANGEAASLVAQRLGLPDGVSAGLLDVFEWWNGGGGPRHLSGEAISPVSRLVNVADYAVFFDRLGGPDAAVAAVAQRAGGYLDPGVAAWFVARAPALLTPTAAGDLSDRLLAAEPGPPVTVADDRLDDVLHVFGDAVDLKSPFLHGHSAGVSALAAGAAQRLGLAADQVAVVRRAAIVQDIGRVTVPSTIWEHPGSIGSDAWMQVRLHAYHSEQMLNRCAALAPLAPLAGTHHERLDGSGYHRGATAAQLTMPARVLDVADTLHALRSARPHRAALPLTGRPGCSAARRARAASIPMRWPQCSPRRRDRPPCAATRPAGLTERQVQVLRLMGRGLSNRAIGAELVISPRTAEHHVQDVYARIGVSSRAAALFAMEHGLLAEDG